MSDSLFTLIAILLGVGTFIVFFMAFIAGSGLSSRGGELESDYVRIICPDCLRYDQIPLDHDRSFTCRCGSRLIDAPGDGDDA